MANSGVAVVTSPSSDRNRSKKRPSYSPAIKPNTSASGMTTAKAMAASSKELRRREKRVIITGRPVLIDSPGVTPEKALGQRDVFDGSALAGEPARAGELPDLEPAAQHPLDRPILVVHTPEVGLVRLASVRQRPLSTCCVTVPSGPRRNAIKSLPSIFHSTRVPSLIYSPPLLEAALRR